jgi:hypothetical protein
MGNYLNWGTAKGAQKGFTLDTLPLMMRCEGSKDKTYTLIRFLMDTLEGDKALRDEALEDMKFCEPSSKLDFDDAIRQLTSLEKSINDVGAIVKAKDDGCGQLEDPNFEGQIRKFVESAQEQLAKLRAVSDEALEHLTKVLQLFCEKPKTPIGETLKKLGDFKKDMEEARRQNLLAKAKKDKAEKKQRENEAKLKAKADKEAAKTGAKASAKSETKAKAKSAPSKARAGEAAGDSSPSRARADHGMKMMNVKIPEIPNLSHVAVKSKVSGGIKSPRETSNGLQLHGGHSDKPSVGRMTLGPGSRPDILGAYQAGRMSVGVPGMGRMSVGVPRSTADHHLSRDELKKLFHLPPSKHSSPEKQKGKDECPADTDEMQTSKSEKQTSDDKNSLLKSCLTQETGTFGTADDSKPKPAEAAATNEGKVKGTTHETVTTPFGTADDSKPAEAAATNEGKGKGKKGKKGGKATAGSADA